MGLFSRRGAEKRRREAAQGVTFDDASWHFGGDFPDDLDDDAGATHIGMFLAWCLLRGCAGDELAADEVDLLRTRSTTPGRFLLDHSDGTFVSDLLDEVGREFTIAYYEGRSNALPFSLDYVAALGIAMEDVYRAPDTWETFDAVAPVVDAQFERWDAQGRPGYLG